jgi:catechol 2,3-dioxygenase-like lactoylglutathione lyase family enzyme
MRATLRQHEAIAEESMPLTQLNHVTVRTDDLEGTRDFYQDVLGLKDGPRPPLGFPGYWLYCGEMPVIHLVPKTNGIGGGPSPDTGNFDHVAFTAANFDDMRSRFKELGIKFREQEVPSARIRQLFLEDPNKVMVELNFPGAG